MTITDLIGILEKTKETAGDLPVFINFVNSDSSCNLRNIGLIIENKGKIHLIGAESEELIKEILAGSSNYDNQTTN